MFFFQSRDDLKERMSRKVREEKIGYEFCIIQFKFFKRIILEYYEMFFLQYKVNIVIKVFYIKKYMWELKE